MSRKLIILKAALFSLFALGTWASNVAAQSRVAHDQELDATVDLLREVSISPERLATLPRPPRDELFHAVTSVESRLELINSVDAGDLDLGQLRNTPRGARMAGILTDSSIATIQFVTLDTAAMLELDDLGDTPMVGDTEIFMGLSVQDQKSHRLNDETTQWTASFAGTESSEEGEAAILITPEGASGFIRQGTDVYEVTPMGDGLHALSLRGPDFVDRQREDYELPPEPPPPDDADLLVIAAVDDLDDLDDGVTNIEPCPPSLDETVVIEIVTGYTNQAWSKANDKGKDVENLILSATLLGNRAFENSGINVEFEIVEMIRLPDYLEGSASMRKETGDLLNQAAGLEPLIDARQTRQADVGLLIVNRDDDGNCGRATGIDVDASQAYAAANWRCLNEKFSYAHEVGHLAGAWHNPEVVLNPAPKNPPYAHGYAVTTGRPFVTVMGYPTTCAPERCPRVWNWSNPDEMTFFGAATGTDDTHNNACLWNEKAPKLAAFGDSI